MALPPISILFVVLVFMKVLKIMLEHPAKAFEETTVVSPESRLSINTGGDCCFLKRNNA